MQFETRLGGSSRRLLAVAAWLAVVVSATAAQVNVAQLPPGWERAAAPVLAVGRDGTWDDLDVYVPRLAKNLDGSAYRDAQGRYYLYYTGSGTVSGVALDATGLALSPDLRTWTRATETPVLPRRPGQSDQGDASAVTVLHDGDRFQMWYEGNARIGGSDFVTIHHAASTDGVTWADRAQVLVQGTDGDAEDLYAPVVIKDGSTWRMWYIGHDRAGRFGMMHATASAPGGPWTKASAGYLFYPRDLFPSDAWVDAGVYHLLYFESSAGRREVKLATSADARTWVPRGATYVGGPAGSWDSARVTWPHQIPVGSSWLMFYDGHNGRDRVIGFAQGAVRYGFIRGGRGAPGPPLDLRATVAGSRVTLAWSEPVSGDSPRRYVIEAGAAYGGNELGRFVVGSTSVEFNSVGNGTYFVRVNAENSTGIGDASNEVTFTVGPCDAPPGAPGPLTAAVRRVGPGAEVTLSWSAPAGGCLPAGYVVEAGGLPGSSELARFELSPDRLTLSVAARPGTYHARVRGRSRTGLLGPPGRDLVIRVD
jgi:predicted GH43/DUF377 family glycosyl hydrolase